MRQSKWAPSIIPGVEDQTVYLVLDDFGHLGMSWRENVGQRFRVKTRPCPIT
jgi:hypothetical protein